MPTESNVAVRDKLAETTAGCTGGVAHRPTPLSRLPLVAAPVTMYTSCKRVLDVLLAVAMLALSAPVVLLACLLVKLTSRGPIFYTQTRVGRGGRPFTLYKIRSMYHNCEQISGVVWSRKGDPRITPLGRLLRRTHIDELPQLWNVLKGDMSLIGPRPERPEFVPQLEGALPHYRDRLLVRPGLTGLAQVHLEADTDLASVERKLAYDLYYIQTLSLWTDARIFLVTAVHVFRPYVAQRWFFRLTAQSCAEAIGKPLGPRLP